MLLDRISPTGSYVVYFNRERDTLRARETSKRAGRWTECTDRWGANPERQGSAFLKVSDPRTLEILGMLHSQVYQSSVWATKGGAMRRLPGSRFRGRSAVIR